MLPAMESTRATATTIEERRTAREPCHREPRSRRWAASARRDARFVRELVERRAGPTSTRRGKVMTLTKPTFELSAYGPIERVDCARFRSRWLTAHWTSRRSLA